MPDRSVNRCARDAMTRIASPETVSMHTRDGVRLDADVYRPAAAGDHPVLLMRQPYGRRIASTLCYAHPAWYAAHGYIVVVQDVRGCGTSAGDFVLFEHEAADGADAVAWAAALPGSTGRVGMYGFSYQGVTQLLAAAMLPPALAAIAPAMIGWDLRRDWAYENGAFCLSANTGWAVQLAALAARRRGDAAAFAELADAARTVALGRTIHARPDVLARHAGLVPHYARWADAGDDDAYWRRISPAAHGDVLARRGPPALFVGGWYDTHLPGTIAAYRAYAAAGAVETALEIGPWAHFPWGRRLGGIDFTEAAIGTIDQRQVAWFDRHLKDIDRDPVEAAAVRLFDTGTKTWRGLAAWPDAGETWHLASDGRAALDERSGRLSRVADGDGAIDHLVHDPWRPVPTVGGAFAAVAGPVERTEVDARGDVLTYTAAPLDAPLPLAGIAVATLAIMADRPSFDVSCILSVVDADGRARHLAEGYAHFAAAPDGTVRVPLRAICATIAAGERLRLSIAAASFPAWPVNPGTGARPVDATVDRAQVVTLRLDTGGSTLRLPIAGDAA